MTRISVKDLTPRMKAQVARILAEESKAADLGKKTDDAQKRSKYKAEKQTVTLPDGTEHTFDSRKEAKVYADLSIRLKAGEITNLRLQVPYELIPKQLLSSGRTERSVKYVADFVYDESDGSTKVVDVKGYRKGAAYALFVIKRKLMKWVHGIEVTEV